MSHTPEYRRAYYLANKARINARAADRQKNDLDYRLKSILRTIIQRCEHPKHTSYAWYGAKGIKNFLTFDQLKTMWIRDGADKMRKPSIDRSHATDNYEFSKCCFRELKDNQKRGWADKATRTANIRAGMDRAALTHVREARVQLRQSLHANPATSEAI